MGFLLALPPVLISVPTAAVATALYTVDACAASVGSEGRLSEALTASLMYAIVIQAINQPERASAMSSLVLSVRLSEEERALLEAASSQARTNVSDFVRRKALEAAEIDVLERRIVAIPAKDWERFEAWVAKPARKIAPLNELARRPPTWRK
jgi:uncharacterized protein (DUF1778 family)